MAMGRYLLFQQVPKLLKGGGGVCQKMNDTMSGYMQGYITTMFHSISCNAENLCIINVTPSVAIYER